MPRHRIYEKEYLGTVGPSDGAISMSSMKRLILLSALTLTVLLLGLAGEDDDVEPFTIVMLPDTQLYSQSFPDLFHGQTKWIRDQAKSQNIVFVSHVGDIVQNGDAAPEEWRVADAALSRLGGVVPWGVAIGNHDYDLDEPKGRGTAYLKYFGPKRFEKYDWYMGSSRNGLKSGRRFAARPELGLEKGSVPFALRPATATIAVRTCQPDGQQRIIGTRIPPSYIHPLHGSANLLDMSKVSVKSLSASVSYS